MTESNNQPRDCGLGNCNVLLHSPGAGTDSPHNVSVSHDGDTTSKDHDLTGIAFLNSEKRVPRLSEFRQIRSRFIEDSCCHSFINGEIDAADECAILAQKG